jgi:hypothetical protein
MNPVSGQSTAYQHDSDTSDTQQNAINTDFDKATKPYLSSEHTDTESGGTHYFFPAASGGIIINENYIGGRRIYQSNLDRAIGCCFMNIQTGLHRE